MPQERITRAKMTKREMARFLLMRSIGNFLLLFALYGVGATFGPVIYYEANFRISQARGIEYRVKSPEHVITVANGKETTESPDLATAKNDQTKVLIPPDTDFSIVIPKIGASAKVYPNVDPGNEQEFLPILQEGVAHAKGTVFPGMKGNIYLFAHSTDNWWNVGRYNAVFYLIKELKPGDEITVFFENRRYTYVTRSQQILGADDVSLLRNSRGDKERLILQTCWPPGTTWKRLYVIATPKSA